jgi:hypothetical protein
MTGFSLLAACRVNPMNEDSFMLNSWREPLLPSAF